MYGSALEWSDGMPVYTLDWWHGGGHPQVPPPPPPPPDTQPYYMPTWIPVIPHSLGLAYHWTDWGPTKSNVQLMSCWQKILLSWCCNIMWILSLYVFLVEPIMTEWSLCRWLGAGEQYLQCISDGDAAVLLWTTDVCISNLGHVFGSGNGSVPIGCQVTVWSNVGKLLLMFHTHLLLLFCPLCSWLSAYMMYLPK